MVEPAIATVAAVGAELQKAENAFFEDADAARAVGPVAAAARAKQFEMRLGGFGGVSRGNYATGDSCGGGWSRHRLIS